MQHIMQEDRHALSFLDNAISTLAYWENQEPHRDPIYAKSEAEIAKYKALAEQRVIEARAKVAAVAALPPLSPDHVWVASVSTSLCLADAQRLQDIMSSLSRHRATVERIDWELRKPGHMADAHHAASKVVAEHQTAEAKWSDLYRMEYGG